MNVSGIKLVKFTFIVSVSKYEILKLYLYKTSDEEFK